MVMFELHGVEHCPPSLLGCELIKVAFRSAKVASDSATFCGAKGDYLGNTINKFTAYPRGSFCLTVPPRSGGRLYSAGGAFSGNLNGPCSAAKCRVT